MPVKSKFILGDEWLYYKLYCGKRTADTVLASIIKPLTEKLIEDSIITQWFFIRYFDQNNHLRIRFHCPETENLHPLIKNVNLALKHFVESDLIWKVQTDTYQRELKRYGKTTIEKAETLFYYDSVTCVKALSLINNDDETLFLFGLKLIDDLLGCFEYDLRQKRNFIAFNRNLFMDEFNVESKTTKQLNKKYQLLRKKVEEVMMNGFRAGKKLDLMLSEKVEQIHPVANELLCMNKKGALEVSLQNLLSSYVHMMVNRMFRDKQRLFELICYDFLFKYYNGILAKYK